MWHLGMAVILMGFVTGGGNFVMVVVDLWE
jgi:hypothetical protein